MLFEDKLSNGIPLDDFDVYQLIQSLIQKARLDKEVSGGYLMRCFECNQIIFHTVQKTNGQIAGDLIDLNGLGFPTAFKHYVSIVSVNTTDGVKTFLLDPVFDQFNSNKYPLNGKIVDANVAFNRDISFFDRLLKQKYFELTEENIRKYISGLVRACYDDSIVIGSKKLSEKKLRENEKNLHNNMSFILNKTYEFCHISGYNISEGNDLFIDDDKILTDYRLLCQLNPTMNKSLIKEDMSSNSNDTVTSFNYADIQDYLTEKARKYLNIIKNEYSSFMSQEQIILLDNLLINDFITVNKSGENYFLNQVNEINKDSNMTAIEKIEALKQISIPLAHGGRVFGDNKIHFYPFSLLYQNPNLSSDELKQKCDEVLIHELLHFFIRPESMNITNSPKLKGINGFTTEGLVDMCARDINQKHGLFPNYNSAYGSNVIFVREALNNIPNLSERMNLVFNGSIQQIYQQTSTNEYNSLEQFINYRDKKTEYDKLLLSISNVCYSDSKHVERSQRFLYNLSANFKSKGKAIKTIADISQRQFPDKFSLIQQQIINYKDTTESINLQNNNTSSVPHKKPFDRRTPSEIEVATQIRQKNNLIAQQKKQQKQSKKTKTLIKSKPTNSSSNNGNVDIMVLALSIIFVASILFIVMSLIK